MANEIKAALEVWLLNQHAGTLWLEQPGAIALSVSLPLQAEPFADQACRPFFSGLLPEGELRRGACRRGMAGAGSTDHPA
ncbi:HipA N-terminal domain-containing protein [Synechococcus sp. CCY9202]|uniref:HipA N-terminal domain-containing protein n=1 Tax=Synechococcus sp. CCY9202 TaxID=174698 RepID=UPI003A4C5793